MLWTKVLRMIECCHPSSFSAHTRIESLQAHYFQLFSFLTEGHFQSTLLLKGESGFVGVAQHYYLNEDDKSSCIMLKVFSVPSDYDYISRSWNARTSITFLNDIGQSIMGRFDQAFS